MRPTGIWQTAWLEPVPTDHIVGLVTTPQLSNDTVSVRADTTKTASYTVKAIVYAGSTQVSSASGPASSQLSVPVPSPHLWSPNDPYLYGLRQSRQRRDGRQTIDLGRSGTRMVLLGAGTWTPNNAQATGTITYTDGSTQSYTLDLNDWAASGASANSQVVSTSPSNVQPENGSSRPVHVYADEIPLASGKTVQSIRLPTVDDGIVGTPQNAFHAFALGVG